MPTALIVEDEPLLRAELADQLGVLWPGLRIAGHADNGIEAVACIDALRPDIVFLDIQMPGLNGMEVARHIPESCQVVFVTAYADHALIAHARSIRTTHCHQPGGEEMRKKWIVIPSVLVLAALEGIVTQPMWWPLWERFNPPPKVAVDGAMRSQTIDALVAKLNDHYVFPDKARRIEAVLRQRQREGKYDAITDGEQLARQLTADVGGIVHDKHLQVGFDPGLVPPDNAMGPPPATLAEFEQRAPSPCACWPVRRTWAWKRWITWAPVWAT